MSAAVRSINKPLAIISALTLLFAIVVFSDTPARASHGLRTLEVTPETTTRGVGTVQTLTATLSQAATVSSGSINIDFENESGANDDASATSPTTPDLTCSIGDGQTSCSKSYVGTKTGTDTWRVWIDEDGLDSTTEADANEGRDEVTLPGTGGTSCTGAGADDPAPPLLEPDCTDVVEVTWTAGAPAALDCDDSGPPDTEREINPAGGGTSSNETYTCTVTDANGNTTDDADPDTALQQNINVYAEVENGVNDPDAIDGASYTSPDYTCTDSNGNPTFVGSKPGAGDRGQCTIVVTQNENEEGRADICFWVNDNDETQANDGAAFCTDGAELTGESQVANGSDPGNDLADQVEKTWATRAASGIDAEPETDTNNFGESHTITVTVYDQFGVTFAGNTQVNFEFFQGSPSDPPNDNGNTPSTPDKTCNTSGLSSCPITYTQSTTAGTDRICAWISAAPTMAGSNTDGTCNGESLSDPGDTAGSAEPASPPEDRVDVVEKRWVNPNASPSPSPSQSQTGSPSPSPSVSRSPSASPSPSPSKSPTSSPSPTSTPTPTPKPQCSDGVDNDGDGRVDHPNDPGCSSSTDPSESPDPFVPSGCRNRGSDENVIVGTNGADVLVGTSGRDVICGAGGDDVISGRGGNDLIQGNGGQDTIGGGGGKDSASGNAGNDNVSGNRGNDSVKGQGDNDTLKGNAEIDTLTGGDGGDSLQGGDSDDILKGAAGNDSLRGGDGDDQLDGGPGKDQCSGNAGNDNVTNCE